MPPPNAYAIEIDGRSAGILVALPNGFMFFTADSAFRSLERRVFSSVARAQRSVRALMGR